VKSEGLILAIDTTRATGSLALTRDGVLLEEVTMAAPDGFSSVLFPEIEGLLKRHGISLADIDCFATAAGPGTFTGVRIGITVAKGLAESTGRPVCAVSNLEALAELGTGPLRAVTIDARRGDIYCAVYGPDGEVIVPERVTTPEQFRSTLPTGEIEFVNYEGPLAAAIARVAQKAEWVDPIAIDANYIRRTDAELLFG
jgi:tRNA threonylcarbamoyladenosine biosynthesis protein TsaB